MADWNELPRDILEEIHRKLTDAPDHYHFGFVCTLWREIAVGYNNRYLPRDIPGLIIPGINCDTSCKTRRFLSFPVGKDITKQSRLPHLDVPHLSLCRGSYEGWLVMIDNDMSMYVFNPFSRIRLDLPSVTALPKPHPGAGHDKSKWYVTRVILSASPSYNSECFVMVIYGLDDLAFCKLGDKSWRLIDLPKEEPYPWVNNGIFYKGQFYVISCYGGIYICDITVPVPTMTKLVPIPKSTPYVRNWYLAESGGALLQIMRGTSYDDDDVRENEEAEEEGEVEEVQEEEDENDNEVYDDFDYDNNYINSVVTYYTTKTTEFKVYKLNIRELESEWIEVNDLNGEALFLGFNRPISLPNPHLFGYKGNKIYFIDDDAGAHKLHRRPGIDIGVFNLEDSTFEPLYLTDFEATKPPAIWITPTPST